MVEGDESCSTMAQEGREDNAFEILVFSSYFFFSPLFFQAQGRR
jgi:hypothetical protein